MESDTYVMPRCRNHYSREGKHPVLIDEGVIVNLCSKCRDKIILRTRYYCKYCGVAMKSQLDFTPWLSTIHKFGCPRSPWGLIKSVRL